MISRMKTKIIMLLLLLVLGGSCADKPNKIVHEAYIDLSGCKEIHIYDTIIPQIINIDQPKVISSFDLLKKIKYIKYIPFERKEIVGVIDKMIVTEDNIYILDSDVAKQILVFGKDGKFLYKVNKIGKGHGEYLSVFDMGVDTLNKEILVNDALSRSYLYYSTEDGRFIRKEKGIANTYVACMNGNYVNLLSNGQDFNDNEDWSILITNKDSVLYKGFEMEPIQKGYFVSNNLSYDTDGTILFTPMYSDTVYQFTSDTSTFPKYVMQHKNSIWKRKSDMLTDDEVNYLIKNGDNTRFSGVLMLSERYAYFNTVRGYKGMNSQISHFWDKKTDDVYEWDMTIAYPDDAKIYDIILYPIAVYGNTFYCIVPTMKILDAYGKTLNPELVRALKTDDAEVNPLLVSFEFYDE